MIGIAPILFSSEYDCHRFIFYQFISEHLFLNRSKFNLGHKNVCLTDITLLYNAGIDKCLVLCSYYYLNDGLYC